MLKNYIKLAWRNLWKNKVYSLINIFGLSIGIAFTLLIGAYVWGELQVNRQLKNAENQYIILSKWRDPNMGSEISSLGQLPIALKNEYPNLVANFYRANLAGTNVSGENKHFREAMQIGDSTLLKMYGFRLLYGDAGNALNDPYSVVITERTAIKYFGKTDVVGRSLSIEGFSGDKSDFMITGVLDKTSRNTVISEGNDYDIFLNTRVALFFRRYFDGWDNIGVHDYLELQKGVDPKAVERAMRELLKANSPETAADLTPYLVPLKEYNLTAKNGLVKKMTFTLSCIALFILLMAIVNFINICIGRSSGRMKEMGIRKVVGGLRKQLIVQFLVESNLIVLLATVFAFLIYVVTKPWFGNLLGKDIAGFSDFPAWFVLLPFLFSFFVGSLAGIYPALVLSALKSVESLKGNFRSIKESILLRKTLVAFQFVTAAIVFIGATVISQQIDLFFSSNLGYDKDYILHAQLPREWTAGGVQKMLSIRDQFAQLPEVKSISLSFEIPGDGYFDNYMVYRQGANPSQGFLSEGLVTDNQFVSTYGIPLKAGQFFNPAYTRGDSTEVVINETASKALGWNNPSDAIGKKIMTTYSGDPVAYTVSGVIADFHFESMQSQIRPITFVNVNATTSYRYFSMKIASGNIPVSLTALQKKWAEVLPDAPFEYHFMDDSLGKLYKNEMQLKSAAYVASVLAIMIVLLGVMGLVSLSIQKRTKEIGIRKVLGSSVAGITGLFLKDFLTVILLSGVVACPLAYVIMQKWLNDYVYRIHLSVAPFVLSIGLITIATIFLIVLQTIRSAFANPIESLRDANE